MDLRALTDAELAAMLAAAQVSILRILNGAQSGSIGNSRSFAMPKLSELRPWVDELSAEIANRADAGGDFILAEFGEAQ